MNRSSYAVIVSSAVTGAVIGAIALNALTAKADSPESVGLVIHAPLEFGDRYEKLEYKSAIDDACKKAGFKKGGIFPIEDLEKYKAALLWCK